MRQSVVRSVFAIPFVSMFLFVATPALAGIADSPLPVLQAGATTLFLYSVPGVIDPFLSLATYFSCTSTDTLPMQVGVECFSRLGGGPANDAVATSLTVAAGGTVIFGTESAAAFPVNSVLGCGSGSARILATSKKLACTAFVADKANDPPTSMVQLTIIAKTKQKAAN